MKNQKGLDKSLRSFRAVVLSFVDVIVPGKLDRKMRYLGSKFEGVLMVLDKSASAIVPVQHRYYVCVPSNNQYGNKDEHVIFVKIVEEIPATVRLGFNSTIFTRNGGPPRLGYCARHRTPKYNVAIKFIVHAGSEQIRQAGHYAIRPKSVIISLNEHGEVVMSCVLIDE